VTTSWVVREKTTGRVVFETFNPTIVARLNTDRYEAVPIMDYLTEFNRRVKGADDVDQSGRNKAERASLSGNGEAQQMAPAGPQPSADG